MSKAILQTMLAYKQPLIAGIALALLVVYMSGIMSEGKDQKTTITQNTIPQRTITNNNPENTHIPCLSNCNNTNVPPAQPSTEEHPSLDIRRHFSLN
jgi:hypothetical protein